MIATYIILQNPRERERERERCESMFVWDNNLEMKMEILFAIAYEN